MEKQFNAGLAYSDFKQRQAFYILAAVVAFAMSSYFVVGYLAGNLHPWEWDSGQWMNAFVGVGITAVMTSYQFFLYSQGDVEGGKKATIVAVCVAVGFSLLSEVGQGMERDNIRMETKSQESPTYKAAVAALGKLSSGSSIGASPYAADIANAQMKYNQCLDRLARGKEPHCEGSKGRLESYQQQEAEWADRASATSTTTATALLSQAKGMERDEANYHPLVNLIRDVFFVSGTVGSFILSLTLISFFEYAFHYLGGQYAKARAYLMRNGYDVTRKLRQPPRKHDGSISTYAEDTPAPSVQAFAPEPAKPATLDAMKSELRGMVASAPEVIATEYNRAQQAREQVYKSAADKADAIQANLNQRSADRRKSLGAEQASKDIYNTIYHMVKSTALPANMASIRSQTARELTAMQKQYTITPEIDVDVLAKWVADNLEAEGMMQKNHSADLSKQRFFKLLYITSRSGIVNGELQPTVESVSAETARIIKIHSRALGLQYSSIGDNDRKKIAEKIIDKLLREGIIIENHGNNDGNQRYSLHPTFVNKVPVNSLIPASGDTSLQSVQAPSSAAPQKPVDQYQGGTGLHNPALGKNEEIYPLPLAETVAERPTPDRSDANRSTVPDTVPARSNTRAGTVQNGSGGTVNRTVQDTEQNTNKGEHNSVDNRALDLIWKAIDKGEITRVSIRNGSPCQVLLKDNEIGKSNQHRREIIEWVFDALVREGVLNINPDFTDTSSGIQKWLINPNRAIKYAA